MTATPAGACTLQKAVVAAALLTFGMQQALVALVLMLSYQAHDGPGVLGSEQTLQLLTEPLAGLDGRASFDWRTAEAALYCVRAVHRCLGLPYFSQGRFTVLLHVRWL